MKKLHISIISAAIMAALGSSTNVMAHAGITGSHFAWDSASGTSPTGNTNGGYLEGTSPIIGATISHTCAHEEPYPNLNHVIVVMPIGKDTLLLDGGKVTFGGTAGNLLPGSLANIEAIAMPKLAQDPAAANAWNFTLVGVKSGDATGKGGATAPKAFANSEFKYQPSIAIGTMATTDIIPFKDSHDKSVTSQVNMMAWGGADAPNERYQSLEFKPTLPKFPTKDAPAGTPGRCATQAKLYFPIAQICEGGKAEGQKQIMTWQMAPTPAFDTSNMGETTFLNSPSLTVNRDLVKNPIPADCPAPTTLATTGAASAYDAATAQTIFVYPSSGAIDKAFSLVKAVGLKPKVATDKVHGCTAGTTWHAEMSHCMAQ